MKKRLLQALEKAIYGLFMSVINSFFVWFILNMIDNLHLINKNIGVTWIEALIICIVVYFAQSEPLSQNSK